jgi:tricorn protease
MLRLPSIFLVFSGIVASTLPTASWSSAFLLLRNPTLSQDRIAFLYADDIWMVPRQGGEARRLVVYRVD